MNGDRGALHSTPVGGTGQRPPSQPFDETTGEVLDPMTAAENRMGVTPLSELLPQRQLLIDKVATLRAKFGTWGTWDALRKVELSRLKGLIRAQATRDKRKVSAMQVDEEAHAHPDYIDFVTLATVELSDMIRLEARIEAIDFTIQRGQSVGRYVANELHLEPRTT